MRIVLLNLYYAPDESATAQLLSDLGAALTRRGHRVDAVASRRAYAAPATTYPTRSLEDGVEVRRVRSTGFGRARKLGRLADYTTFLLGAAWTLSRIPRPDVVVALSTPPLVASLGWAIARLRRARVLFWVMDVYPDLAVRLGALREGSPLTRAIAAAGRRLLRGSDRVVALDRSMAARLEVQGAKAVHVLPNWADGDAIRPAASAGHALRARLGWEGRFVVLYSGNMGLVHEFETILDAAARLADDPGIVFAFVGGGPRKGEIEAGARRRGLRNVEFHPYVTRDSLGESLTAGDVHAVTLRDGMDGLVVPSKIYGILAAGRPTVYVGPPAGEVHDIVSSGCGVSLRNGDSAGLAEAIVRYRTDRGRAEAEGVRARALFDERYTRETSLSTFVGILESLGARGTGRKDGNHVAA